MSGFDRQSRRAAARVAFNKFSEAFRREKSYQQLLLGESQEYKDAVSKIAEAVGWEGKTKAAEAAKKIQDEILKGQPLLGKKPPFGTWMKAVARAMQAQQEQAADEVPALPEVEGEWNDDGTLAVPPADAVPQVELKIEQ
ncbi:MAG: hypothetical protein ACYDHY_06675 [Acidiferrobacterales bacterium]